MFTHRTKIALMLGIGIVIAGCSRNVLRKQQEAAFSTTHTSTSFNDIEVADVEQDLCVDNSAYRVQPRSINDGLPDNFRDLTLDEAVTISLQNPKVLRSLGAQGLSNPQGITTRFDPAIQESNPNFGVEAALSQFDAQLTSSLNFQKNDDVFNNVLFGGGANEVQQDLVTGQFELAKTTASGTSMALRSTTSHDFNNAPQNLFNHSWTSFWEAELRQPLMQGRGIEFNRIAGPNGQPGFRFSNGVLISRVSHDISIAEFERGVRDFVVDVTASYWQLQRAYQNFFTLAQAREASKDTWQTVKARFESGVEGGEQDREAEAREQYLQFEQRYIAALNGDQVGQPGLLQSEADLRRLIGMPQNDEQFLRPIDEIPGAAVAYDWDTLVQQAVSRRVELRQQKWRIKQRELELLASRNFLLPRLDVVSTFRNNGFGDDLVGGGSGRFASAFKDLASGNHHELALGIEYNAPVGFRRAHAAVRNAELNLCRERTVLEEQERQILHDLGSSFRLVESKFTELSFAKSRVTAAGETVAARNATYERDLVTLDVLLDSQRRLADAELSFHQVANEYVLAQLDLMREGGKLLASFGVVLSEEQPTISASDNQRHWYNREYKAVDFRFKKPPPVSFGAHDQSVSIPEASVISQSQPDYMRDAQFEWVPQDNSQATDGGL